MVELFICFQSLVVFFNVLKRGGLAVQRPDELLLPVDRESFRMDTVIATVRAI